MPPATGPRRVVLREVARRTGVSHNAAYRHFSDRAQLLAAVSEVAMDSLEQAMRRRIDALDPSRPGRLRPRLPARDRPGYVEFALHEQGLFRVAFSAHRGRPRDNAPEPDGGPYGMLNAGLDRLVEVGTCRPATRRGRRHLLGGGARLRGRCIAEGPLGGVRRDRAAALATLLLAIDRALGAGGDWPEVAGPRPDA